VAAARHPCVADVGSAGDRLDRVCSDPHGWTRSLDGLGADRDIHKPIEAAVERRRFLRPEGTYRLHRLGESNAPLGPRNAEALELQPAVALPDAKEQLASAHHVEKRGRFGHLDGVCQWKKKDGRTQIAAGTLRGEPGQHDEGMEHHMRRPERVVMGGEDSVESALVRSPGHHQGEIEGPCAVHLARVERPDVDAELHAAPSSRRASNISPSMRQRIRCRVPTRPVVNEPEGLPNWPTKMRSRALTAAAGSLSAARTSRSRRLRSRHGNGTLARARRHPRGPSSARSGSRSKPAARQGSDGRALSAARRRTGRIGRARGSARASEFNLTEQPPSAQALFGTPVCPGAGSRLTAFVVRPGAGIGSPFTSLP
jgi:hypothetical protein